MLIQNPYRSSNQPLTFGTRSSRRRNRSSIPCSTRSLPASTSIVRRSGTAWTTWSTNAFLRWKSLEAAIRFNVSLGYSGTSLGQAVQGALCCGICPRSHSVVERARHAALYRGSPAGTLGRGSTRLLLAVHCDELCHRASALGTGQGPSPARMARGYQGGSLLLIGERHDPADAGARG